MDDLPAHQQLDLADPAVVVDALLRGAEANNDAACRDGAIDHIDARGPSTRLVATGDLHDNPHHFGLLLQAAGLVDRPVDGTGEPRSHLTLHEIIHSDRLIMDMDFSFRALARVAALKAEHPELVHCLLANHEIAQMLGSAILKNGVRCVEAFNDAIDHAFGEDGPHVRDAVTVFVRSMPLALRVHTDTAGDLLCCHSLPGPAAMGKFDAGILARELTNGDYVPRQGSAHLMVWGRGYDHEQLEDLVERWGVNAFILGHEHAEHGSLVVPPNALVLNSDHQRGVYLPIDLTSCPSFEEMAMEVVPISQAG
ncbi:MAG: hypothetical protein AAF108_10330 [Planctomycetota bacterium]